MNMDEGKIGNVERMRKHDPVRKRILIIYAAVIGIGALYTVLIYTTGFGIPCLFNQITGLQCPGCGTSRMALAVMRFDFAEGFMYNPVAFVTVPVWVLISIGCYIGYPASLRQGKVLLRIFYVNVAAYIVFGIVRNVI
ncbi:MAG: DUF2752 domain-containing protein [Bacillota bacterium]|nr:DUF2752 domain-containing protein [Bacillota bacterium]